MWEMIQINFRQPANHQVVYVEKKKEPKKVDREEPWKSDSSRFRQSPVQSRRAQLYFIPLFEFSS